MKAKQLLYREIFAVWSEIPTKNINAICRQNEEVLRGKAYGVYIYIYIYIYIYMIDQNQLENVESFKYLGSILTKDGRCTCEIKYRTAMAKAAFNKKRALFTSTLDLELRKKLVKCCILSIALYGAETWTLRAVDQKHLESFEM